MGKYVLSIVHDERDACGILLFNNGQGTVSPSCRLKLLHIVKITGLRLDQQVDVCI